MINSVLCINQIVLEIKVKPKKWQAPSKTEFYGDIQFKGTLTFLTGPKELHSLFVLPDILPTLKPEK
ncbi:MAG: hypothetical protein COA90_07665 [Gammaproteobacteria bacterium]|nr:MAG: hypothetical protein COA90_07665 [Gammaproteobacteria bacterium]